MFGFIVGVLAFVGFLFAAAATVADWVEEMLR